MNLKTTSKEKLQELLIAAMREELEDQKAAKKDRFIRAANLAMAEADERNAEYERNLRKVLSEAKDNMPRMSNNGATVEIKFIDYPNGYIRYSLSFLHSKKSFLNPESLTENPVTFYEEGKESLIPFFESFLEDEVQSRYEPLEPDVRIEGKKLPHQFFRFTFLINESKIKQPEENDVAYGGFIPALTLEVSRVELWKFVSELRKDYDDWALRNNGPKIKRQSIVKYVKLRKVAEGVIVALIWILIIFIWNQFEQLWRILLS
ncbi:MAG: hypothetical protein AAB391_02360 [Patescibacteria group bacterium]